MEEAAPDDPGDAEEDYEAFEEEWEEPGQAPELGGSHVFKVLCPASLGKAVLGDGGANQRSIEEDTCTQLHLSAEDELFPFTNCQILAISAAESGQVLNALDRVIEALVEAGEVELGGRRLPDADSCVGREDGEFIFRACLPGQATGKIIGPRGAYIEALRKETGAKVFVENDKHNNHQMLRIIGVVDAITSALPQILDAIDSEIPDEEQRKNWWLSTPFQPADEQHRGSSGGGGGDGGAPIVAAARGRRRRGGKGRRGGDDGVGSDGSKGARKGAEAPNGGRNFTVTPRQSAGKANKSAGGAGGGKGQGGDGGAGNAYSESWAGKEPMEAMRQISRQFPSGALDMKHGMECDLPGEKVEKLFGRDGEFSAYVGKASGATVWVEEAPDNSSWSEYRKLHVQGPLIACYVAHCLVMKKYHELEQQSRTTQAMQSLQAQVEQLQRQLEDAKRAQETTKRGNANQHDSWEAAGTPPSKARKIVPAVVPPRGRGGGGGIGSAGHSNGRR